MYSQRFSFQWHIAAKTLFLAFLMFSFISCEKIGNVNVLDTPDKGNLNYKVVDDDGEGVPGAIVSVYKIDETFGEIVRRPDYFIKKKITGKDGIASFSDLLPRNYLVVADSVLVNQQYYSTQEYVQVIAGVLKEKQITASDFFTMMDIYVASNLDGAFLKNVNVASITTNPQNLNITDLKILIDNALIFGVTDEMGKVSLKVPLNSSNYLIFYNDDQSFGYAWSTPLSPLLNPNSSYILNIDPTCF